MHELPFVQSVLEIALRTAAEAGARRITAIDLTVGQLSSIVDDAVQFYWDILSQGTLAEGAQLRFHRLPAVFRCEACGQQYTYDGEHLTCPRCGSAQVRLIQGDEFRIDSVDVD